MSGATTWWRASFLAQKLGSLRWVTRHQQILVLDRVIFVFYHSHPQIVPGSTLQLRTKHVPIRALIDHIGKHVNRTFIS